ncbi:YgfZ/GcvT domain-containing protein [Candidatus Palauibacter sp.]|uniref:CAF17-like 4Fe-4S cluster assembly/insertion protein YgfZ n=1 Tax=Candidatus Palauibacter sp. TaxID=3101350 RepID=UPI003B017437
MAASQRGSRVSAREPFFTAGYEAALDRAALFPDFGRRVVAVSGAGALRVMDGLASNDASEVERGRATYSYLLDRRGRVVVDLRLLPAPDFESSAGPPSVWLDVPSAALGPLIGHLETYVPPILAVHRPTEVRVISVIGPLAGEAIGRWEVDSGAVFGRRPGDLEPLEATTGDVAGGAVLIVRREEIEGPGFDLYVDPDGQVGDGRAIPISQQLEGAVVGLGGIVAADDDWEILRIERGLPAFGSELGPERLAQEAGQVARAISLDKGCYTGQEVVARIHYRGHVNRHLRGIRGRAAASGAVPSDVRRWVGSGLHASDGTVAPKRIGIVTSAVDSPRFGPVGLAYVRREIDPGDMVRSAEAPEWDLQVAELPFTTR